MMSGGGTPDEEVVRVQVVVVDASVDVTCCISTSVSEMMDTVAVASVTVAEVEIVVVLVFGAGTSPFSSLLIMSLPSDDVELRRLNLRMLRGKNRGLRTAEF